MEKEYFWETESPAIACKAHSACVASMLLLGGLEHVGPEKFQKIDVLRLHLRAFWSTFALLLMKHIVVLHGYDARVPIYT